MNNFEIEHYETKAQRDERWEALMLVKPHVVKGTDVYPGRSILKDGEIRELGHTVYWVGYPRLVMEGRI